MPSAVAGPRAVTRKPRPTPAAVEETLTNRRSLNANQRTAARQDLSAVKDGVLTGRAGGKQVLGPAAQRSLASAVTSAAPAPASAQAPAWRRLADMGVAGQGSAAANMAKLATLQGAGALGAGPMRDPGEAPPGTSYPAGVPPAGDTGFDAGFSGQPSAERYMRGMTGGPTGAPPAARNAVGSAGGGLPSASPNVASMAKPLPAPAPPAVEAAPLPLTMDIGAGPGGGGAVGGTIGGGGIGAPGAGIPPPAGAAQGFAPNLPSEIMQRLQVLSAGGSGPTGGVPAVTGAGPGPGMAKPGMAPPGGPGPAPFNFADYWSQGGRQMQPYGVGGGPGPVGSYAK